MRTRKQCVRGRTQRAGAGVGIGCIAGHPSAHRVRAGHAPPSGVCPAGCNGWEAPYDSPRGLSPIRQFRSVECSSAVPRSISRATVFDREIRPHDSPQTNAATDDNQNDSKRFLARLLVLHLSLRHNVSAQVKRIHHFSTVILFAQKFGLKDVQYNSCGRVQQPVPKYNPAPCQWHRAASENCIFARRKILFESCSIQSQTRHP
jgi:hypothetical protein